MADINAGTWRKYRDPDNFLYCASRVAQDREGRIWIGTTLGICRYDGREYRVFNRKGEFPPVCVSDICADRRGNVWIAASMNGLWRYDGKRFVKFTADDGLKGNLCNCLAESRDGSILVAGGDGVQRYDGKGFSVLIGKETGGVYFEGGIRAVCEDASGRLWIAGASHVSCWDRHQGVPLSVVELQGKTVLSIYIDRDGMLLLGTDSGLVTHDGKRTVCHAMEPGDASPGAVGAICQDTSGTAWLACNGAGPARFFDGRLTGFPSYSHPCGVDVKDVMQDREGVLWFACGYAGVCTYEPSQITMLSTANVDHAMIRDRKGRLWWGSRKSLMRRDADGKIAQYDVGSIIASLLEDRSGRFWIGTYDRGLLRYSSTDAVGGGEKPEQWTSADGLQSDKVWRIFEDSRGTIWIGSSKGLTAFDGKGAVKYDVENGLAGSSCLAVAEDARGHIMVGGWSSIDVSVFDGSSWRRQSVGASGSTGGIKSFVVRGDTTWVGTTGGLVRYRESDSVHYGVMEGLGGSIVETLAIDTKGIVWIGLLGGGVSRFDGRNFQSLTEADGLPGDSVVAFVEDTGGAMIIATHHGICRYAPSKTTVPYLVVDLVEAGRVYQQPQKVNMVSSTPAIRISFHGLSSRTSKIRYNYVMDNYDKEWRSTWNGEAVYSGLPPGEYTFRLAAISKDLAESDAPVEVGITVFADPRATQFKELESEIRARNLQLGRSEHYREKILATMSDALLVVTADGLVESVNDAACGLLGYGRDELVGRPFDSLLEGKNDLVEQILGRKRDDLAVRNLDETCVNRDGQPVPVLISASLLVDETIGSSRAVFLLHDIREKRTVEKELREANTKLAEALERLRESQETLVRNERLRALGSMASGVAHDFNNALVPILGFSELLLQNEKFLSDPVEARDMLGTIREAAMSAAESVRLLRDFYRPSDIKSDQLVDVGLVVEETINMVRSRQRADTSGRSPVEILSDIEPGMGINGSKAQMAEMLVGLLTNSIEAMPGGGTVTVSCAAKGSDRVALKVKDTGVGMSSDVVKKCFEPFFTTKGPQGSGLGLSMVYGTVQRHGGHIEIESEPGKGTLVTISLPRKKIVARREEAAQSRQAPVPGRKDSQRKVLVIDDEVTVLKVIGKVLQTAGFKVDTAASGKAGLEKFAKNRPDVVILDRAMPDLSGDEVARRIREGDRDVPVIMLTGVGGDDDLSNGPPMGVDKLMKKPVSLEQLKDAVLMTRHGETAEDGK